MGKSKGQQPNLLTIHSKNMCMYSNHNYKQELWMGLISAILILLAKYLPKCDIFLYENKILLEITWSWGLEEALGISLAKMVAKNTWIIVCL